MANINDNERESQSQCAQILAYLEKGYSITQLDALNMFKCMRLASRINDLRNKGYKINACKIKTNSGKSVCEYVLVKD